MPTVELPWPSPVLSPNARGHWSKKAKAVAAYRRDCHYRAAMAGVRALNWPSAKVDVLFCPPDARKRDRDNMIAAFKAGADGVASASGVDDANWEPTYRQGEPVKGGKIVVTMEHPDTWRPIGRLVADIVNEAGRKGVDAPDPALTEARQQE